MVDENKENKKNNNRRKFRRNFKKTKSSDSSNGQNDGKAKIKEYKFHMHDSAQRKTSESFGKIRDAIILKINKTFDAPLEVVESIRTGAKIIPNEPTLVSSTAADPLVKQAEDALNLEKWKIEFSFYYTRKDKLEASFTKAFSLIWENYCAKEMQVAIQEIPDFGTRIRDNPIELLKVVESLMHTPERAKYPPLTLVEVMLSFLKIKQGDNEDLIDYLARFKSEMTIVYSLFGKGFLDGFCEEQSEYKTLILDENKNKFKKEMLDKFIAVLFLRNSNYERYNSMLVEYRKDFANKCNKYPANLQAMMDVMRQVPIKKKKPPPKTPPKPTDKDKEELATSLAQKKEGDGKDGPACFICGDPKCRVWRCEKKGKLDPKDWHNPEKAKEYEDNHAQHVEFSEEVMEVFGGMQLSDGKGKEILDSGSTITLCTNEADMKNVRDGPKIVMVTNNGRSKINKEGD